MQPNSSYPPAQDPDQNNEPPVTPTPTSWDMTPRPQSSTTPNAQRPTPTPQQQPRPDFARYQPQPLQSAEPEVVAEPKSEMPAPNTIEYTEQEPDTTIAPVTQQNGIPQETTPAFTAQPENTVELQTAAAPQLDQAQQSVPPTAKPKKKRLGLIIASILVGILLLGGGAAAYVMNQPTTNEKPEVATSAPAAAPVADNKILNDLTGTREDYLNQAIENHMKSTYVQQDYAIKLNSATVMTVDIKGSSDFTNVKAPKSFITFGINYPVATTGELVLLGDNEKYAKLSQSGIIEMTKSETTPKLNQWYHVDTLDLSDMQLYDPLQLNSIVNTPSGILLIGNFDSAVRNDLMKYIKENQIYTIKNSEDVTVDGQAMTHYDLTIDAEKVSALNLKARTALNATYDISETRFVQSADQTNEIWIDKKTGRIAKILLTTGNTGEKATNEMKISYPTAAASTIAKPANAIAAPMQ